jgi:RsiW-degrading membrane proteinase PrsW (M82 family)
MSQEILDATIVKIEPADVIVVPTSDPGKWQLDAQPSTSNTRMTFWVVLCACMVIAIPLGYLSVLVAGASGSVPLSAYLGRIILYALGYFVVLASSALYLKTYNAWWTLISLLLMMVVATVGSKINAAIFSSVLEGAQGGLTGLFRRIHPSIVAFFMAGFPEEAYKIVVYILPLIVSKKYRTIKDAFLLSLISGASFGLIENLLPGYLFGSIPAVIFRSYWTTALHATLAATGCLFCMYMKAGIINDKWYWYPLVWIIPAALHGIYDCAAFSKTGWVSHLIWPIGIIIWLIPFFMMAHITKTLRKNSIIAHVV